MRSVPKELAVCYERAVGKLQGIPLLEAAGLESLHTSYDPTCGIP